MPTLHHHCDTPPSPTPHTLLVSPSLCTHCPARLATAYPHLDGTPSIPASPLKERKARRFLTRQHYALQARFLAPRHALPCLLPAGFYSHSRCVYFRLLLVHGGGDTTPARHLLPHCRAGRIAFAPSVYLQLTYLVAYSTRLTPLYAHTATAHRSCRVPPPLRICISITERALDNVSAGHTTLHCEATPTPF